MRIIGGAYRSRRLEAPEGDRVRPTTDRVREAMFNVLGARMDFAETRVLDCCAGSGALGLEALSRGAGRADFVDTSVISLGAARRNAENLDVQAVCRFHRADAVTWLENGEAATYDLILADPPYAFGQLEALILGAIRMLRPGGLFILEHDRRAELPIVDTHVFTRSYGKSAVSLYQQPEQGTFPVD